MSINIETVVTDEFEMKYFKFGEGERTAVVLPGLSVKSVMGSADSIASAYRDMKDDYTVYVFDRRVSCPDDYSIEDMARDTARAFEAIGLENIYLYGVSQGGMIAQLIAVNRPGLVSRLALCSTVSRITKDNSCVIEEWITLAERGDEESLNKRIIETLFSDAFSEKYGEYIARLMSGASAEDLKRFIILAKACGNFDVSDRLGEIKCPTLVIGGKADRVFDYNYIAELAEKSGARMKTYEEYGHAVYDETPDCLKEVIKFFADYKRV